MEKIIRNKKISLIGAALICFTLLSGCGQSGENAPAADTPTSAQTEETSEITTETEEETSELTTTETTSETTTTETTTFETTATETTAQTTETPETAASQAAPAASTSEMVTICGKEYPIDTKELVLDEHDYVENKDIREIGKLTVLEKLTIGYGYGVTNISPLSSLTHLKELSLGSSNLVGIDISPLASLTEIETLSFGYNTDLSVLKQLPKLKKLSVSCYSTNSLEIVSSLSGLRELRIDGNIEDGMTDLEFMPESPELEVFSCGIDVHSTKGIERMPALKELYLNSIYKITDMSMLKDLEILSFNDILQWKDPGYLPSLKKLSINSGFNDFYQITGFDNFPALTSLYLDCYYLGNIDDLSKLPNLEELTIDAGDIYSLDGIQKLSKLKKLDLKKVSSNGLFYYLCDIPALEELSVETSSDVYDLSELSKMKTLKTLNLTTSGEVSYEGLETLTSLETFTLSVKAPSLEGIEKLSNLTGLYTNDTLESLEGIEHCSQLTQLKLREFRGTDLSPLAGLTGLEGLSIILYADADLTPIGQLTGLKELDIGAYECTDISPLANLTGLTSLAIETSGDLSHLANMTELTSLILYSDHLAHYDISSLAGLTALEELHASHCNLTDISVLSGMTNMRRLNIYLNPITDISPLSGMTKLEELTMYETDISDVSPLKGAANLRELYLESMPLDTGTVGELDNVKELHIGRLTADSLDSIEKLQGLESLEIYEAEIGDISAVGELTGLKELSIRYMEGGIDDFSFLYGMTSLEKLHLEGVGLTDEAAEAIREKLPDCELNF